MPLAPPNLDDRRFEDLVAEARRIIAKSCPEWTDLSPGDPGMTLVEVFAYLTDLMLYRLNHIPDKAYAAFLGLIGVQCRPPAAAYVRLHFRRARTGDGVLEIPRGTRVTTGRTRGDEKPPVFVTTEKVTIEAAETTVQAAALHCDQIDAELLGIGTGLAGLSLTVGRPSIIAPTGDTLDLVIGIEVAEIHRESTTRAIRYKDKTYRIWREVENFTNLDDDRFVYMADRLTGTITFAPTARMSPIEPTPVALAEIPPAGRQIRAWYRRGGGDNGNVMADALTELKDPLGGLEVRNPRPATGGRDAESLSNALVRGPQDLHALRRAVTARDFELIAKQSSGAIDRAHAFTKARFWAHATPGTVEMLLVPRIPDADQCLGPVTESILKEHATETARAQIQQVLDRCRPLGSICEVKWARCKSVQVIAQVIVQREENPSAIKDRVMKRLFRTISPLATTAQGHGWPFGKPLTGWDIYKVIDEEPGVRTVRQVRLRVNDVPDQNVASICTDLFQPGTWYAGSGERVYRTTNNGDGWETVGQFTQETVVSVKAFDQKGASRSQPGLLAAATVFDGDAGGSAIHISRDCGETWATGLRTTFVVADMAWVERDGVQVLLLATEKGLYEYAANKNVDPYQVLVDPDHPSLGFYAVTVSTDIWGGTTVAVAARKDKGIYLSVAGGKTETFNPIGLEKELVRVLAFHQYGPNRYLWAGATAIGNDPGKGCYRWRLTGEQENPEGWLSFDAGWSAGGCRDLTFSGPQVFAASLREGVLRLDISDTSPSWIAPDIKCRLPLQDTDRIFQPVDTVAAGATGSLLLSAGVEGVYRSADGGARYAKISDREFTEQVTLPETWLFCSSAHNITVVSEDES